MVMLWLYRTLCGYLRIKISGEFAERLLNNCAAANITLWNIRYKKGCIFACISALNFKRLRQARKGMKIHISICEKHGLPFLKNKYKKRMGLFVGLIAFFLILYYLSGFIWVINVEGNNNVSDKKIISACAELGIKEGVRTGKINSKLQKDELLLKMNSLAWASLNIEGCVLTVNVSEVRENDDEMPDSPTNIKASADGIIKKIDVTSGNCVVKVGDAVKKGDLLVSGIIEHNNCTEFVHSLGTVNASTTREFKKSGLFMQKKRNDNGTVNVKKVLNFYGIKIPLFISAATGDYDTKTTVKQTEILGKKLPISITKKIYRFKDKTDIEYTKEELSEILYMKIEKEIEKEGIKEYSIENKEIREIDGGIECKVLINSDENIAKQDILLINSGN